MITILAYFLGGCGLIVATTIIFTRPSKWLVARMTHVHMLLLAWLLFICNAILL